MDEQTVYPVADLVHDAADAGRHDRAVLPHRLDHRQPESLGETLLYDHRGVPL